MARVITCLLLVILSSCGFTAALPVNNSGKIWALLVAGSNTWDNYRHQADVCHAYQILHRNGIPDENIIVMMFDDIANDENNPTPGVIINYPGGPDVYKGVPKDYTGENVNPTNFLHILAGNKTAMKGIGSGKVIESGPDDLIFVNFADHGGPGVLCFPQDDLPADDLLKTIELMTGQSKFSKLILYVEACYSGSMFDELLAENTNVFALTAAATDESSYACYYDEKRQTYLGDVFSVVWMNDAEHENLPKASLHHQFEKVRHYTNTSHVEEYGDLDIGITKLKEVLAFNKRKGKLSQSETSHSIVSVELPHPMDTADNMDIPLVILQKKKAAAKDPVKIRNLEMEIHNLIEKRLIVDEVMNEIIVRITNDTIPKKEELITSLHGLTRNNFPCYRKLYNTFSENCISLIKNTYPRVHLQKFINMCHVDWVDQDTAISVIMSTCSDILGSMELTNIK